MTTLKQIIEERIKLTKTGYPNYMTEDDYILCFKEWLQQKQKESEYPCWAKTIIGEFLKELNQIPENCPLKYKQFYEIPIKCPCYYKGNCEVFNNAENIE